MLAHKKFGLPLPLLDSNPYRITAVNLYNEGITIPEGCLSFIDKSFIDNWVDELKGWLAANYPEVKYEIYKEVSEVPLYKIKVESSNVRVKWSEFDKIAPRLTLKKICDMAIKRGGCEEFFRLLREQLPYVEYKELMDIE